jgi:hypothetical protein
VSVEGRGLGIERPSALDADDDEFDAYRKRMMLAYRFRPNPLVCAFCINSNSFPITLSLNGNQMPRSTDVKT